MYSLVALPLGTAPYRTKKPGEKVLKMGGKKALMDVYSSSHNLITLKEKLRGQIYLWYIKSVFPSCVVVHLSRFVLSAFWYASFVFFKQYIVFQVLIGYWPRQSTSSVSCLQYRMRSVLHKSSTAIRSLFSFHDTGIMCLLRFELWGFTHKRKAFKC